MNKMDLKFRDTPWITEPANDFLAGYLRCQPMTAGVLEFGMGSSTLYFTKHEKIHHLGSIEHDKSWYDRVTDAQSAILQVWSKKMFIKNILQDRPYHTACEQFSDDWYDIVLVDGRDRVKCIEASIPKLRSGGILILDNSERENYRPGIDLMKDWNTIITRQLYPDKYGFYYPGWETRIFFKP